MVDDDQKRIAEDLAGSLQGDYSSDPVTLSMYSTDASIYQIQPLGVAFPRSREDLITLSRYSTETETPLIARGAGTGLAGGALGQGIIVDFSRYMRNIIRIDEKTVRVQPGIVLSELNDALRPQGRAFAPDPSNYSVTTLGGMLGVDAAGSRAVRIGSTRNYVKSVEVVLSNGHCIEFGVEASLESDSLTNPTDEIDLNALAKHEIVSRLSHLLTDQADLIASHQPRTLRNCCGYYLNGIAENGQINVPRLLVGSEGTLAMFSEVTLHTSPIPQHRGVALLLFGKLEDAVKATQLIGPSQPSACDLLDRRLLSLGRDADKRFASMITPAAEAGLLVEQTANSDSEVNERLQLSIQSVQQGNLRCVVARTAIAAEDVDFLWSLASRVVALLSGVQGNERPIPFIEDIAVPPEMLSEFLVKTQNVFQKHRVTASLYSHALSGQVHLRPFMRLPRVDDGQRIESLARDLYQVVFQLGGTISGEHGDGLSRTAFIRSQYGPLYRVFQEIKEIFDPHHLLNPGKIISDDQHLTLRNFRSLPDEELEFTDLQLRWQPGQLANTAVSCNGCGECRTHRDEQRMCPFFREDIYEGAAPRSKANLLRELITGPRRSEEFASAEFTAVADLCFNCKQCQQECPSKVDIPHLVLEAKASLVATNGLNRTDWFLTRIMGMGRFFTGMSFLANPLLNIEWCRWIVEKLTGISRKRRLPRFASRSFLQSAGRSLLTPPDTKTKPEHKPILFFVDHFANNHDPELARAMVAILRHNGVNVFVPPKQKPSGMALISAGDLDTARELAEHNVRELSHYAREGYQIICTEPSAVIALTEEYPLLLDHPDANIVAAQVIEAGRFLDNLKQRGKLRTDFSAVPINVAYHTPCHLKSLGNDRPLESIMAEIPELVVHHLEKGCSGMAGLYGMSKKNFDTSVAIGADLMQAVANGPFVAATSECASCRLQMAQAASIPVIHPIKILAFAYGLLPTLEKQLKARSSGLVVP